MARAVAGEAGVPFFFVSASEFEDIFVGVGAKRVRELFQVARKSHGNEGILVMAATNFAEQLDPALTRAGRFDVKIQSRKENR